MQKADSLHLMTLLGREVPETGGEVLFTDIELNVLREYADGFDLAPPDDLASAILLVALMGGYMNRKHDPPAGSTTMSRGYVRLETAALMFSLLQKKYGLWPP